MHLLPGAGTRNRGFTVVEIMITLLVLSVLVVITAPALTNLIKDNRLLSQVYALRAALNAARSQALAERTLVMVCPSTDGGSCAGQWHQGFIAFTDMNGNGQVDDPNDPAGDEILVSDTAGAGSIVIRYDQADNRVRFNSRGYSIDAAGSATSGTFTVCDDRGQEEARGVIVAPVGGVRAALPDPNDPSGRVLDFGGNPLECE